MLAKAVGESEPSDHAMKKFKKDNAGIEEDSYVYLVWLQRICDL